MTLTNYKFKQNICKQLKGQIKKLIEYTEKFEKISNEGGYCDCEEIACYLIDTEFVIHELISSEETDSKLMILFRYLEEEEDSMG